MRDIFKVFAGFTDRSSRRGRKVYNLVNTNETPIDPNNPYSSTTTTIGANGNADNKETNASSESLSPIAVIDRILFKGRLSQEENKTKSKYYTVFIYTVYRPVLRLQGIRFYAIV